MGSPADLTLGRSFDVVISGSSAGGERVERMRCAEKYMSALEDERKKIEAFKRELPFCMQLLSDAIEASKLQLADYHQPPLKPQILVSRNLEENVNVTNTNEGPIFEEFIPLKNRAHESSFEDTLEERENQTCDHPREDRSNGLIEAKLWAHEEALHSCRPKMCSSVIEKPYKKRESLRVGLSSACSEFSNLPLPVGDGEVSPYANLFDPNLAPSVEGSNLQSSKETPNTTCSNISGRRFSPPQRKPRRCWSPELHRRFVNALQQLGGSDVATPKQIRELMKVDDLTNDEVKSHLQKYRLHTRRPNPANFQSASASPQAAQVLVLGGIWVPPEFASHAAGAAQIPPPAQQAQLTFPQVHYAQLNGTSQLQLDTSPYADEHLASASSHSQGSLHGQVQATGQSPGHSLDTSGREESAQEDGNDCSTWKAVHRDQRFLEVQENEDTHEGNIYSYKWRQGREISGEDDSEAEDSREYDAAGDGHMV